MADAPRYCKKCELPFVGPTCPKGHPVFLYSKKIPEGKEELLNMSQAGPQSPPPADRLFTLHPDIRYPSIRVCSVTCYRSPPRGFHGSALHMAQGVYPVRLPAC